MDVNTQGLMNLAGILNQSVPKIRRTSVSNKEEEVCEIAPIPKSGIWSTTENLVKYVIATRIPALIYQNHHPYFFCQLGTNKTLFTSYCHCVFTLTLLAKQSYKRFKQSSKKKLFFQFSSLSKRRTIYCTCIANINRYIYSHKNSPFYHIKPSNTFCHSSLNSPFEDGTLVLISTIIGCNHMELKTR